jgi:lipopolysaccharide/colanic/teichoic acid biosynthesis glycosyltransferase
MDDGGFAMKQVMKRVIDVAVSGSALLVLWPVMALIAIAILWCDSGPVLFRQARPGYKGRAFTLLKFRTMSEKRDTQGQLLPDRERLTALGEFLRGLSLDELPQLWNVLRGDISLVGPRPLLTQYLERYSAEEMRRHEVKPGITGWAQVNGRNATTWPERFALDLWYVEHWSLGMDARILLQTFWQTLKRSGIAQPGHATMPEFSGNEHSKP